MLKWEARMETGVKAVDEQHKELVDKINELVSAMKAGKGREVVGDILVFLGKYAVDHFSTEERLMDRHGYPDSAEHKSIHEAFKADFGKLVGEYEANPNRPTVTIDVPNRVMNWLRSHILNVDAKLGKFLTEKGVA